MSEEEKSSSVRYVKFSGKGSDFNEWKVKTLALARRKGFAKYLKEDLEYSTLGRNTAETRMRGIS